MFVKNVMINLKKYSFLLQQLVSRDFKVKYKRSVLGIVWSLLYPILTMIVMAIVFSNVFKFSTPNVNYLAYLLSGLVMFNYFSEASNLSMSSVVANFGLLNKIYIPKYIFPLSKCLFVGINFLLTLIPLYIVLLATGTGDVVSAALIANGILVSYIFTICVFMFIYVHTRYGIYIISSISIFKRYVLHIWNNSNDVDILNTNYVWYKNDFRRITAMA